MIGFAVNGLPRSEMLKRGIYSLGVEDRLTVIKTFSLWRRQRR